MGLPWTLLGSFVSIALAGRSELAPKKYEIAQRSDLARFDFGAVMPNDQGSVKTKRDLGSGGLASWRAYFPW
jgi:hypothetical protein